MAEIKLRGDKLDRGRYALMLYRIIGDYKRQEPLSDLIRVIGEYSISREIQKVEGEGTDKSSENESDSQEVEDITDSTTEKDSQNAHKKVAIKYTKPLNSTDNDAFIMAISAKWGSGKTTFVKQLKDVLALEGIDQGKEFFDKSMKLSSNEVKVFDAWVNDFYDDPLEPFTKFMANLIGGAMIVQEGDDENSKKMDETRRFLENLQSMNRSAANKPIDDDEMLEKKIENLKDLIISDLNYTEHKKVVVIIDELDRCRPTYAIRLMEIIKHLFNVPGIVFIFALDINELQHSIKVVYGNEFNAIGYLERFFDYTSLMPEGEKRMLFENVARECKVLDYPDMIDVYYDVCNTFDLSAREIRAVCTSYYYLKNYGLMNYPDHLKQVYFYLLVLKYKFPDKVKEMRSPNATAEKRRQIIEEYPPTFIPSITPYSKGKEKTDNPFKAVILENDKIGQYEDYRLVGKDGRWRGKSYSIRNNQLEDDAGEQAEKYLEDGSTLSLVLCKEDLDGMESNLTILDYMFRKIELYDVVVPTEQWHSSVSKEIHRKSIIEFGRYPQGENGEEAPIEWIVLDRQGDELLLISKYALDCQPYNAERKDVTWEECSLKEWLDKEFYEAAFREEERMRIRETRNENKDNPEFETRGGNQTTDRVFLLSIEEAEKYFGSDGERRCRPTPYAIKKSAYVWTENKNCRWWLRSPGHASLSAARVYVDGSLDFCGLWVDYSDFAVRPSLRLHL